MVGLLAWAADVVEGEGGGEEEDDDEDSIPFILTPDRQQYLSQMNRRRSLSGLPSMIYASQSLSPTSLFTSLISTLIPFRPMLPLPFSFIPIPTLVNRFFKCKMVEFYGFPCFTQTLGLL